MQPQRLAAAAVDADEEAPAAVVGETDVHGERAGGEGVVGADEGGADIGEIVDRCPRRKEAKENRIIGLRLYVNLIFTCRGWGTPPAAARPPWGRAKRGLLLGLSTSIA